MIKNKFKKIGLSLAILLVATACKKEEPVEETNKEVIEVEKDEKPISNEANIKAMTFASKLIMDNIKDNDNISYIVGFDKTYSKIEQGDFDVAIVPAYLGPYFYQKNDQNIKLGAITQTGNIFMISDTAINDKTDLKGKNVYVPDPVGNLSKVINEKIGTVNLFLRLNIEYYKDMGQILDKMDQSSNFLSILSNPYYTKAMNEQYYVSKISDILPINEDDFLTEIIIVNGDYLVNHKKDFNEFLASYKNAIDKLNNNPDINEALLKEYDLSKDDAKLAIKRTTNTFIDGDTMKGSYEVFLDRLSEVDDSLIGEIKPTDEFYYKK